MSSEVTVTEDGLVETNYDEVIESFDDMGLKEDLLRGIYSYGFEKPSAIQQRAIKPLIMMRDSIAQAQSGTGKTATFTIGLLQNPPPKGPLLGKYLPGLPRDCLVLSQIPPPSSGRSFSTR